jgi:hypothetical protein
MKRTIFVCLALVLAIGSADDVLGVNYYDGPESVAYDSLRNRYLVCSARNGLVISVDSTGEQSVFKFGLGLALGNCIKGDTLYVTTTTSVVGIDLEDTTFVFEAMGGPSENWDGVTTDTSGYMYVVETLTPLIYKINMSDASYTTFVSSGLPNFAQDVIFDIRRNRLLVASFQQGSEIMAISLEDSTVTEVTEVSPGMFDGITIDPDGAVYAGTYLYGAVYRWDSSFTNPPDLLSWPHNGPAGLDYNWSKDVLAVPNFNADSVAYLECHQPELHADGIFVEVDGVDEDSFADPGETLQLTAVIRNNAWEASNVAGTLASIDPYVAVSAGAATFGSCPAFRAATAASTLFTLTVDSATPDPYVAPLELTVTPDGYPSVVDTLFLFVGDTPGFADSFEAGADNWSTHSRKHNYTSQWHVSDDRSNSGAYSWKLGDTGSGDYASLQDAALVSPPFLLPDEAVLRFSHWMQAQGHLDSGTTYDGGIVAISSGDGNWTTLMPDSGYKHKIAGGFNHNPLDNRTPCFGGTHDWREETFDLSAYSGVVQIMFRFCADGNTAKEGWYIDDVVVESASCCANITGNVDGDEAELIDIGDLTALISYMYIPPNPEPLCLPEANIDGDPELLVDIGDLTALISYLYIPPNPEPATCD